MNWTYSIRHWLATVLLGSLILEIADYLSSKEARPLDQFFPLFLVILIFSFVFSIPTMAVYLIVARYVVNKFNSSIAKKLILIIWTVVGIVTTLLIVGGKLKTVFIVSYTVSAFVIGILLKYEKSVNLDRGSKQIA